ncbi:PREDICTED: peroxidase 2-like [Tarenaya hassleriana]|uniref:peroxidase 2-like n=1 Tax=Tarenaya hassleriana TaxID=28532 RepID=UPI00053C68F1|nr:PREDICTED: peroxidase 2-like [Tarenaya hassleriana]
MFRTAEKMATKSILAALVLLSILGTSAAKPWGLKLDYYRSKCPDAEAVVQRVTYQYVSRQPSLAAGLLRMHFHDCFVRGCDGSVLLKSPNKDAERDAIPNLSLRGYEVVDAAKSALEKKCPGVVSCADVIALVARDAVSVIRGPYWPVPLGRRDGRVSKALEVFTNLPSPFANIAVLKQNFLAKGLNVKDLVVLSGGHTIGISHCSIIHNRLYNFTGKGDFDPSMNPSYVRTLKKRCNPNDFATIVDMDPGSVKNFDSHYFNVVAQKKGLFTSDATLLDDPETKTYVETQVSTGGSSFARDFSDSMIKLGFTQVLTGKAGEIRKKCAFVN